jgi:hypothetical protein
MSPFMSVFGPAPIEPRGPQAGLAAQQAVRPNERAKPAVEASRRMRDQHERRIAGTEADGAIRRSADEHADDDASSRRQRRDGRADEYRHVATEDEVSSESTLDLPAKPAAPPDRPPHLDLRA